MIVKRGMFQTKRACRHSCGVSLAPQPCNALFGGHSPYSRLLLSFQEHQEIHSWLRFELVGPALCRPNTEFQAVPIQLVDADYAAEPFASVERMIKLVYCITKKPGMTDAEFFHYWEHVHGPIGARIPGVRRLVQSHRVHVPGDAKGADYDGMAELWFDDMEALLEARRSPEWRASGADEENFIDHSKVAYFISAEHPIV